MKSEQNFRVTYDGPALQAHTMDVRELAPALLSMAKQAGVSKKEFYSNLS